MVCEEDHVFGIGNDAFFEGRLVGIAFAQPSFWVEATAGKKHPMDIVAKQHVFRRDADERFGLGVEESASAEEFDVRAVGEGGDDVKRVGQDREGKVW